MYEQDRIYVFVLVLTETYPKSSKKMKSPEIPAPAIRISLQRSQFILRRLSPHSTYVHTSLGSIVPLASFHACTYATLFPSLSSLMHGQQTNMQEARTKYGHDINVHHTHQVQTHGQTDTIISSVNQCERDEKSVLVISDIEKEVDNDVENEVENEVENRVIKEAGKDSEVEMQWRTFLISAIAGIKEHSLEENSSEYNSEGNNIALTVSTCITQYVTYVQTLCTELSRDVRTDSLDRDIEIDENIFNMGQNNHIDVNESNSRISENNNESKYESELRNNNQNGNDNFQNTENKNREKNRINSIKNSNKNSGREIENNSQNNSQTQILPPPVPVLTSQHDMNVQGVSTVSPTILPLGSKIVLERARIIFKIMENLSFVISSFIEIITPHNPHTTHTKNNEKISKIKVENRNQIESNYHALYNTLLNIIDTYCKAIESVSTVMYVIPVPFIVSFKDWAKTIQCLLHCRAACVHVLTVLTQYNNVSKEILGANSKNKNKNENKSPRTGSFNLKNVPLMDLECSLGDMENILTDEVSQFTIILLFF